MESIGEQKLVELIPLEGPFQMRGEKPCLKSFVEKRSKLLCFEATVEEGARILIQQKGCFHWQKEKIWEELHVMGTTGTITCKSIKTLERALYFIKKTTMSKGPEKTMQEVDGLDVGQLASAIVMVLTIGNELRVCGKYVRWCKPESRRKAAFEVDRPVIITAGVDVDVSSEIRHVESVEHRDRRLSVRIDSGTRLNLIHPLLVSEANIGTKMICGGKAKVCYLDNERIDEFHSEWNLCYSTAPDSPKYWTSKRCFSLH